MHSELLDTRQPEPDERISHILADGREVVANSRAEAIASCPFLSSMPVEQASIFLDLIAEPDLKETKIPDEGTRTIEKIEKPQGEAKQTSGHNKHVSFTPELTRQTEASRQSDEVTIKELEPVTADVSDMRQHVEEIHSQVVTDKSELLSDVQELVQRQAELEQMAADIQAEVISTITTTQPKEAVETEIIQEQETYSDSLPSLSTPVLVESSLNEALEVKIDVPELPVEPAPVSESYELPEPYFEQVFISEDILTQPEIEEDLVTFTAEIEESFATDTQLDTITDVVNTTITEEFAPLVREVDTTPIITLDSALMKLVDVVERPSDVEAGTQEMAILLPETVKLIRDIKEEVESQLESTETEEHVFDPVIIEQVIQLLEKNGHENAQEILRTYAAQHTLEEFYELLHEQLVDLTKLIDYQQHLIQALNDAGSPLNRRTIIAQLLSSLLFGRQAA